MAVTTSGLSDIRRLGSGFHYTLALKGDGSVYAWGLNVGRLGDGTTAARTTPVKVLDGVKLP